MNSSEMIIQLNINTFIKFHLNIILLLDEQSRDPPLKQWSIQENIKL